MNLNKINNYQVYQKKQNQPAFMATKREINQLGWTLSPLGGQILARLQEESNVHNPLRLFFKYSIKKIEKMLGVIEKNIKKEAKSFKGLHPKKVAIDYEIRRFKRQTEEIFGQRDK